MKIESRESNARIQGSRVELRKIAIKNKKLRELKKKTYVIMNCMTKKELKHSKKYQQRFDGYYYPNRELDITVAEPLKLFNLNYKRQQKLMTEYILNLIEFKLSYRLQKFDGGTAVICIPCMDAALLKKLPQTSYYIDKVIDEYSELLKDINLFIEKKGEKNEKKND
jgi:hypothetical protein